MRPRLGFLAVAVAAILAGCASTPRGLSPLAVVDKLEVQRYMGRWYEVARFQHGFERGIVGATAEYSLNPNGTVTVVNSGFKNSLEGKYTEVRGVARIPDTAKPSRLKVKFFGLFEADYLVFGLDDSEYGWALVGSDSRSFLWFLSRTPEIDEALYDRMKSIAEAQGYKLESLYKVPQKSR